MAAVLSRASSATRPTVAAIHVFTDARSSRRDSAMTATATRHTPAAAAAHAAVERERSPRRRAREEQLRHAGRRVLAEESEQPPAVDCDLDAELFEVGVVRLAQIRAAERLERRCVPIERVVREQPADVGRREGVERAARLVSHV